jgi:PPK2 family polyphosphate:nucleotide phosphotransferase
MADPLRVRPGERVKLSKLDAGFTGGLRDGSETREKMRRDIEALAELQALLYAARSNSVLVVLQGIDTAGKDGTIRHVFTGVNPQGCRVASFKKPTEDEAAHDYLWRVHREVPGLGEMVIFNRSHYESVLVERVHRLVPESVWRKRYAEIRHFEKLLLRSGTIVLKFFLNLSKSEQKRRLEARLDDPDKRWKSNPEDWRERRLWARYREAYEDMLSKTSTRHAPWFVIPSDAKWYRNLAVADRLAASLGEHEKDWRRAVRARGNAALRAARRAPVTP